MKELSPVMLSVFNFIVVEQVNFSAQPTPCPRYWERDPTIKSVKICW